MAINTSEIASLLIADHGQAFAKADGTAFTGVFVIGASKRDEDAPRGVDAVTQATITISAGVVGLDESQRVTRTADGSVWEITLIPPAANGLIDVEVRQVRAISRGAF